MITTGILGKLHEDHQRVQKLLGRLQRSAQAQDSDREELFEQVREEILVHRIAEERTLYAMLVQHEEGREQGKHATEEHAQVEAMLDQLDQMEAGDADWLPTLSELAGALDHHIEDEERNIAPLAQRILGDDKLVQLGDSFAAEKQHIQARMSGSSTPPREYEEETQAALYQLAQEHDIPGRSYMTREELLGALRYGAP